MNNNYLTNDAKRYLFEFDDILNKMAQKMLSRKITTNITDDFITCMIPHHQAAIYMCQSLLNYTNYEPLKMIAYNIIKTQTNGIKQMQYVLNNSNKITNSNQDINFYNSMFFDITTTMVTKMISSIRSININLDFVSEMIPHHEGAVEMCNNLLKYSINPELRKIATDIIRQQTEGIKILKEIQQQLSR